MEHAYLLKAVWSSNRLQLELKIMTFCLQLLGILTQGHWHAHKS